MKNWKWNNDIWKITPIDTYTSGPDLEGLLRALIHTWRSHNKTSMSQENQERYLWMVRNLINNIWKELCYKANINYQMPHIVVLSEGQVQKYFHDTWEDISIMYIVLSNTIVLSSEFIEKINSILPVITRDICIALAIAHEFWHALVNQTAQHYMYGKWVENMCDTIAGFTFRKMEEIDLITEDDRESWRKMFLNLGAFDIWTHGGPDERVTAFERWITMSDDDMVKFLHTLNPRYQLLKRIEEILGTPHFEKIIIKNN